MKFYCLGYYDEKRWLKLPEAGRNDLMDECFEYDDLLRRNGHFAGGDALQGIRDTVTLRWKDGKVSISNGPLAKSKEELGGILVLEARDTKHAVELLSKHPGLKVGPFEVRAVEDMSAAIEESRQRRSRKKIA